MAEKKRSLSRREFMLLAGAASAAGILSACQPQVVEKTVEVQVEQTVEVPVEVEKEVVVTATPAPVEQVNIRFTEGSWVGPEGISFWSEEIVDRFQLENPDITLTFENAENPDYVDKLYAMSVAGDAPDVWFTWDGFNYDLMQKGLMLPLDDYFDDEYLADFNPTNLRASMFEGHLYGLPKEAQSHTLAYNKDILDEAGVNYPDGTWDWDDYLAACRATTKRDTSGDVTQWGTYVLQDYIFHWVWMNNGKWSDEETFAAKCLLDEPEAMEALKVLHGMVYGPDPVAPQPGAIPDFGWWNVFSTGRVAFVETCSWQVTNYIRENDFRWDFAPLATGRDGTRASPTYASQRVAYSGTEHPSEAVRVVEFLSSTWSEKQACIGIIGALPGRRSLFEVWDQSSMAAVAGFNAAAFTEIEPFTGLEPRFLDQARVDEIWDPIWDQIWVTGELALEEGVELLVNRVNDYFANA